MWCPRGSVGAGKNRTPGFAERSGVERTAQPLGGTGGGVRLFRGCVQVGKVLRSTWVRSLQLWGLCGEQDLYRARVAVSTKDPCPTEAEGIKSDW